jgi:hypothetical protein
MLWGLLLQYCRFLLDGLGEFLVEKVADERPDNYDVAENDDIQQRLRIPDPAEYGNRTADESASGSRIFIPYDGKIYGSIKVPNNLINKLMV